MTPPIIPERNIVAEMRAALAEARKAGVSPEQMDFLLRAWGREVENFNEAEQLAAEQLSPEQRESQAQMGGVASLIKDIPGAEALAAGARSVVHRQPYREALGDIREGYEAAPRLARIPNRIIGGAIAGAALPVKSPAMAGAVMGGAANALSADPDQSLGERALKTGVGAGVGGVVGKVADVAGTALRTRFATKLVPKVKELEAARSATAGPMFQRAMQEGAENAMTPRTPQMEAYLNRPEVRAILDDILPLDEFAGLTPDDPKVLAEVARVLSDDAGTIVKRMGALDPSKPNTGRAMQRQLSSVKRMGLDAMSRVPGAPMPSYAPASQEFAKMSRPIEAVERGYQAAAIGTGAGGSPKVQVKRGPESLLDWIGKQTEDVSGEAAQGALAFGRKALESAGPTGLINPMRTRARNFLIDGGSLLRAIEGTAGENAGAPLSGATLLDFLQRASAGTAAPNLGRY